MAPPKRGRNCQEPGVIEYALVAFLVIGVMLGLWCLITWLAAWLATGVPSAQDQVIWLNHMI